MRGRRAQIDWREDEETLCNLCQQENDPQKRRRLQALWQLRQEKTIEEAAQDAGVHYRTVQRWVAWYRQGGVDEVRRHRSGGHDSQAPGLRPEQELKPPEQQAEPTAQSQPGPTTSPRKSRPEIFQTSYRLDLQETLPTGIRRIALEQIDRALGQLTDPPGSRDKAVHDARKCFKKVRAVLRLVRDEVGQEVYKRENICYRDAGRRLAPVRDSAVMVETLDQLTERFAGQLVPGTFAGIREKLVATHQSVSQQILDEDDAMAEVTAIVQAARPRIADLPIIHEDFSALYDGLRRVYRRGRNRRIEAYAEPSPERFHEWRKRLKYLWYHMRILRSLWPDRLQGLVDELKELADVLGDSHDLAVLGRLVLDHPEMCDDKSELQLLMALVEWRRSELEATARLPGKWIYVEKQRAFADRIAGYWQVWRDVGFRYR